MHVDLSGAPQTMLATLYAKALDADFKEPILGDRFAKEIVEQQCGNRLVRSAGSEDLLELLRQCR